MSVGYQPSGTAPVCAPVARSKATAALLPASATNKVLPLCESARPSGVDPSGDCGTSAASSRARTVFDFVSMTSTMLSFAHATYSDAPSGETSIALGCGPTLTRATFSPDAAFTTSTDEPAQSLT